MESLNNFFHFFSDFVQILDNIHYEALFRHPEKWNETIEQRKAK